MVSMDSIIYSIIYQETYNLISAGSRKDLTEIPLRLSKRPPVFGERVEQSSQPSLEISLMGEQSSIRGQKLNVKRCVLLTYLYYNFTYIGSQVLNELNLSGCKHIINIIGNHELYNFSREDLDKRLGTRMNGSSWYSYKPWSDVPLRLLV